MTVADELNYTVVHFIGATISRHQAGRCEPGRVEAARGMGLTAVKNPGAVFAVVNVALIALRRDLSIRQDEISSYLVGDYR